MTVDRDTRGFFGALVGDGRPLISFTGLCLILSGAFALFQSLSMHFLPHDVAYLGMTPQQLCSINECRIVHFMIHDRISFGGALVAVGVLYLWLAAFPLRHGERWAWWTLTASGLVGFGSFLTYLGYGYLDTWHGAATLALLPCFVAGLVLSRRLLAPAGVKSPRAAILEPWSTLDFGSPAGLGRVAVLIAAAGMIGGGLTIQAIGMTYVFVDTDLEFMGLAAEQLAAINPRLVPLIAHDRAGFGGAVATAGLLTFCCVWFTKPTRSLWQALFVGGIAGWSTAVFVHPAIGYTDPLHLAPAVGGASLFFLGLALMLPGVLSRSGRVSAVPPTSMMPR
ncbi:MAG: hypothetical protein JNL96_22300 [Planctomycetaceae bacterium]|nr:hypothetical protein [Planctomycetaceae bacterium]